MPISGAFGLPLTAAFGAPVDPSPLRAVMRQTKTRSPSAQAESDATMAFTLDRPSLPGSIGLYMFAAEAPNHGANATNADLYGVSQSNVAWTCGIQHGNLDQQYPFYEVYIGRPLPGYSGGTAMQPSHRGGWCPALYMEIVGIKGYVLGGYFTWFTSNGTHTITSNIPVPEDCLVVLNQAIDSGAGALGTLTNAGWRDLQAGDGRMSIRGFRKGEFPSVTLTSVNGGSNTKTCYSFMWMK